MTSPFRGRWLLPTILIILLTILFLVLGSWQLQRRSQRLAANAQILARLEQPPVDVTGEVLDPDEVNLRRATVRGVFDYDQEIVLRNRTWNELPGVHVLVPLRIAGSDDGTGNPVALLVDRGWIPYDAAAPADRAQFHNASGEVEVYGILRQSQVRRSSMSPADPLPSLDKRVDQWHRVDLPKIRQQVPYPIQDVFLEEDTPQGQTPRMFPKPQPDIRLDEGSHLTYAIQWFAFALIAAGGYAAYYTQRSRPRNPAPQASPGEAAGRNPS